MKKILILAFAMGLAGCDSNVMRPYGTTGNVFLDTAPGAEIPVIGIGNMCRAVDEGGRCKKWDKGIGKCVNPKGHDAQPPVVPCASIQ